MSAASNTKQNRSTLEGYFVTNAKPTAGNFGDLIVSGINQKDDDITVSAEQNVGFGDTSPNSKVSVKGNTSVTLPGTVTVTGGSFVGTSELNGKIAVGDVLEISNVCYLVNTIQTDGFTFTTTPPAPDSITTGVPLSQILGVFSVNSSSGDSILHAASNKNVGINTKNPSEALEVNGTIKATTFSGSGASLTDIPGNAIEDSPTFSGVVSASTFSGSGASLTDISGNAIEENPTFTGTVSASAFSGDGSQLTGISSSASGIQYFRVETPIVTSGTSANLSWKVSKEVHSVALEFLDDSGIETLKSDAHRPAIIPNQTKYPVTPPESTCYTLTAYDKNGNFLDQAQLFLTVQPNLTYYVAHTSATSASDIIKNAAQIFNLNQLTQYNVSLLTSGLLNGGKSFTHSVIQSAIQDYYTSLGYVWTSTNTQWVQDIFNT